MNIDNLMLRQRKVGFMGTGNMTQAIVHSLLSSNTLQKNQIVLSNRTEKKLDRVANELDVAKAQNNEELVDQCDVVVLAMKPQDLIEAIEPIAASFGAEHLIISLAAGISLQKLKKVLIHSEKIVRVIPNTPVSLQKGVVGYCTLKEDQQVDNMVETLFSPGSKVFKVAEGEDFEAITVAASSGIGFLFELMTYWQEWLQEYSFNPEQARQITVQSFLGAASLASEKANTSLVELQKKVASKKGVTAAGLDSMRELEIERLLRYSFEKAVLRDRELGKDSI